MSNGSSHQECIAFLSSLSSFEYSDHSNSSDNDHFHHGRHTGGHSQSDFQFDFCMWLAKTIVDGRYYLTACAIVLFLDIILTLDVEIERVWNTKFTKAKLLFYLNRYLPPILYSIALFGSNHPSLSSKFCTNFFQEILPVLIVFGEAAIGALLILRTRALYQETKGHLSYVVQGVLIIVYLVQIALSVLVAKDLKAVGPLRQTFYEGCILFFHHSDTSHLLTLWFTNIFFNVIVFMCTFKKTAKAHWSDRCHAVHSRILVDATVYFIAVMAAKVMNLAMLVFYPQWNSINWISNHVIDVILTSHYFLHLREEGGKMIRTGCTSTANGFPRVDENTCHPRPAIIIRIDARPIGSTSSSSEECTEYVERNYSYSPTCYNRNKPLPDIEQGCIGLLSPVLMPVSPGIKRFSRLPESVRLSVQRAIEEVLAREGCAEILVCTSSACGGDFKLPLEEDISIGRESRFSTWTVPAVAPCERIRSRRRRHSLS